MQRFAAPTTGNPDVDNAFGILGMAIQKGHNAAAFLRGYDAYGAGKPMPLADTESEGYITALHGLTWDEALSSEPAVA